MTPDRNAPHALVVVESVFGNTRHIADAVADGLSTRMTVTLADVTQAPQHVPPEVGLLVVGGPTHTFGMTRPATRRDAARQAGTAFDPDRIGLREWLAGIEPAGRVVTAAAFDTRTRAPRIPGSAAHRALAALRRLGFMILDDPTTFWVRSTPGPLLPDEVRRARRWGEQLAELIGPDRGVPQPTLSDLSASGSGPVDLATADLLPEGTVRVHRIGDGP